MMPPAASPLAACSQLVPLLSGRLLRMAQSVEDSTANWRWGPCERWVSALAPVLQRSVLCPLMIRPLMIRQPERPLAATKRISAPRLLASRSVERLRAERQPAEI